MKKNWNDKFLYRICPGAKAGVFYFFKNVNNARAIAKEVILAMKELSEPFFRAFIGRVQKLGYTDLKNMTQRLEKLVVDMQPQEPEPEQEPENELEV